MIARFAPTEMRADVSKLSPGDRKALAKLIEASRILDDIFLKQLWSGNQALCESCGTIHSAFGKARLEYFWINKGPWSDLDDHAAFLPGVPPKKLPGANFYPEDMSREEFEAWAKTLSPAERRARRRLLHGDSPRRQPQLRMVPYSQEYEAISQNRRASSKKPPASPRTQPCKKFLLARAAAFRSERLLRKRSGLDGSGCAHRHHHRPLRNLQR